MSQEQVAAASLSTLSNVEIVGNKIIIDVPVRGAFAISLWGDELFSLLTQGALSSNELPIKQDSLQRFSFVNTRGSFGSSIKSRIHLNFPSRPAVVHHIVASGWGVDTFRSTVIGLRSDDADGATVAAQSGSAAGNWELNFPTELDPSHDCFLDIDFSDVHGIEFVPAKKLFKVIIFGAAVD